LCPGNRQTEQAAVARLFFRRFAAACRIKSAASGRLSGFFRLKKRSQKLKINTQEAEKRIARSTWLANSDGKSTAKATRVKWWQLWPRSAQFESVELGKYSPRRDRLSLVPM